LQIDGYLRQLIGAGDQQFLKAGPYGSVHLWRGVKWPNSYAAGPCKWHLDVLTMGREYGKLPYKALNSLGTVFSR